MSEGSPDKPDPPVPTSHAEPEPAPVVTTTLPAPKPSVIPALVTTNERADCSSFENIVLFDGKDGLASVAFGPYATREGADVALRAWNEVWKTMDAKSPGFINTAVNLGAPIAEEGEPHL